MRIFLIVVACLIAIPTVAAAKCTPKVTKMSGSAVLSTSTYYARPGQDQKLYDAVAAQNRTLAKNHLETYTLYRGAGGAQPAAFWEMTFPSMAAHDAWFKHANAMVESASEKAIDKQADDATLRFQHAHYIFHNGFNMNTSECT